MVENIFPMDGLVISFQKLLLFCVLLYFVSMSEAAKSRDELRREFFKENILSTAKPPIEKQEYQIFSVQKGRITGFYYEGGTGTQQIFCIEVKFKINEGKDRPIPHLFVYLYDNQKKPVARLKRFFYKETTGSKEIDGSTYLFKTKRTHVIQFDYPPEVRFKYYLAVVGDSSRTAIQIEPGSLDWKDFEFEEKSIYEKSI